MTEVSPPVWRFIPPLEAPGTVQMAIDRWLFRQHCQGRHPPTLRFYTWNPAAISLGYHQRQYPDFWNDLIWQDRPVEIVRRPTGGRAVLHQGDLTYMVVTSGLSGKRSQTYRTICEFLIRGWRSLGLELQYGNAGRGYIHNPSCFSTATSADLVAAKGEKVIGSAQLRQGSVLLQHGSIRLSSSAILFSQVFGEQMPLPPFLTIPKGENFVQTVIDALIQAAQDSWQIELKIAPLSESERQAIACEHEVNADSLCDR